MPESPDVDLTKLEKQISEKVAEYGGEVGKTETEPVAFGLKALKVIFVSDESKGSTDELEENIKKIEGINSVEVIDVRRALG